MKAYVQPLFCCLYEPVGISDRLIQAAKNRCLKIKTIGRRTGPKKRSKIYGIYEKVPCGTRYRA